MKKKHSTRRHPWLHRVDKIFEYKRLLEIMDQDDPNRPEVERMLAQVESADPVDYLNKIEYN